MAVHSRNRVGRRWPRPARRVGWAAAPLGALVAALLALTGCGSRVRHLGPAALWPVVSAGECPAGAIREFG